jgi:small subunit ribosomal protein S11
MAEKKENPAPAAEAAATPSVAPKKKKTKKRNVKNGIAHIQSTFNNTIVTITDVQGNVVSWSTAGARGFKGSRKGTPYAAQLAAADAAKKARDLGMENIAIFVNGPGAGRESAVRAFAGEGMRVSVIRDVTPIPHNGCRAAKRRRV